LKDVRGHVLAAVIVECLECYSETEIPALFLGRNVNLLQEEIDVGLRIGELPDLSLRALCAGSVRQEPADLHRQGPYASAAARSFIDLIAARLRDIDSPNHSDP
jgi:DNA-binding transcriptional LysR family regulator